MTNGPVNANDLGLYIGGVLVACMQSLSFSSENSVIEVVCKDYTGSLSGKNKWSLSGAGALRFDAAYGAVDLLTAHKNRDSVVVKFSTEVTGDTRITGTVTITKFDLQSDVDKEATWAIEMQGQGDYVVETIPA
jgi:predicted secreted protein